MNLSFKADRRINTWCNLHHYYAMTDADGVSKLYTGIHMADNTLSIRLIRLTRRDF